MANITLMGASFSDVPAVTLPQTGGGTVTFYENGGGGTLKPYVIRPDAELIQTYSADELLVADLEKTIPAYSTSAQTVVTGAVLSPKITVDFANYDYYITFRGLAYPIYASATRAKGYGEYTASAYLFELLTIPANEAYSLDGTKKYASRNTVMQAHGNSSRCVYWTSASAISIASSAYGAYVTAGTPTISSSTLSIKAPNYLVRGNATYMSSAAWADMTDIREQWRIEVWRAPKADIDGWELTTSIRSVLEDVRNGGTLT